MSDNTTLKIAQAVRDAISASHQTVTRLTQENDVLHRENYRLRHELSKARLLTDMRRQHAGLVDDPPPPALRPAFLRRQAD